MKAYFRFLLLVLVLSLPISELFAQTDKEGAKSVVKITTSFTTTENGKTVKKISNASGWCWKDSRHIITDLHVVAGIPNENIKISTNKGVKECGAKVEKVLYEADLALLVLDADLGLVPLDLQDADPNSKNEFSIWGFPHGIDDMSGDEIRFSRSLTSAPTLNSIVNGNELKFTLEKQGYPLPKANILRISSTIQPGHSGAPIFADNGKVVGIADGGLREGTARLNWAMPASKYVPLLLNSNEAKPNTRSVQVNLYATTTTVAVDATEAEQNMEMEKEAEKNTIVNGDMSISKTWTASYDEIIETMAEEDVAELKALTDRTSIDMTDTQYDIYEDFNTGATITIPSGEYFSVSDGWFYTNNADSTLFYDAMPFDFETFEDAKNEVLAVYNDSFDENDWDIDPNSPDTSEIKAGDKVATYQFSRVSKNGDGQMLLYYAEVDGSSLLVTYLIYDINQLENIEYLKKFLHYAIAMEMATFAEY
jgi:S1-C subfamily serine protease